MAGCSLFGEAYRENGDAYAVAPELGLAAVVDAEGTEARDRAALDVSEWIQTELLRSKGSAQERLLAALRYAHAEFPKDKARKGGAASVAVALVEEGSTEIAIAHTGDVRVYSFRERALKLVGEEQSLARRLRESGDPARAREIAKDHHTVIVHALGLGDFAPETRTIERTPGERFLLATDGLWRHLDDETLRTTLESGGSTQEIVERLCAAGDLRMNRTAVLISV